MANLAEDTVAATGDVVQNVGSTVQNTANTVLTTLGGENAMVNFKIALVAAILAVVLSMFLPNVLPNNNDEPDNFFNGVNNVLNAHKDNLLAGVVVIVLVVLVGGLIASKF